MDTYAHFFDKHDKKMVDTLDAIQRYKRRTFSSEAELITKRHDTVANTLTRVFWGYENTGTVANKYKDKSIL